MINVTTKEGRGQLLLISRRAGIAPSDAELVALCNHIDALDQRVERMQAVVDAASLLTDAIEDLAGKGCATYKATHNAAMTGETGGR